MIILQCNASIYVLKVIPKPTLIILVLNVFSKRIRNSWRIKTLLELFAEYIDMIQCGDILYRIYWLSAK